VEEKTVGRIPASSVTSISIQVLRKGGPEAVYECLSSLPKVQNIVNARTQTQTDTHTKAETLAPQANWSSG
jgi:hypothetical protein